MADGGARSWWTAPLSISAALLVLGFPTAHGGRSPTSADHGVRPADCVLGGACTWLTPADIQSAYGAEALVRGGSDGAGFTVAVVDPATVESPAELVQDLLVFSSRNGIPPIAPLFVRTGSASEWSAFNATTDPNADWVSEDPLDVEAVHLASPGASILVVLTPDSNLTLPQGVAYVVSHRLADVISLSWEEAWPQARSDGIISALEPSLRRAAQENITVVAASGDCGAGMGSSTFTTSYPGDSAWILSVGGTILNVSPDGTRSVETGWNGTGLGFCRNQGGSGGGYGPFYVPTWERISVRPPHFGRGIPDVSAVADSFIVTVVEGGDGTGGGTSLSCPLWAGWIADIDSYLRTSVGFADPLLYRVASNATLYHESFYDVRVGNNGYAAGPGWDPVTGLGTPNVVGLAAALWTELDL